MPSGTLVLGAFLVSSGSDKVPRTLIAPGAGSLRSECPCGRLLARASSVSGCRFLAASSHGRTGARTRAPVASVRLHAHGLTTPRRPRALTPSRGRISARGIRGTRALRPLHRLPLRQLRGSVLGLGLASPGRKAAAAAPAITASHDSVQCPT